MSVHWYFVSFSFIAGEKRAWGNTEIPIPQRVTSIEDVRLMQLLLEQRYKGDVLIVYYALLRVDDGVHESLLAEIRIAQALLEKEQNETVSSV